MNYTKDWNINYPFLLLPLVVLCRLCHCTLSEPPLLWGNICCYTKDVLAQDKLIKLNHFPLSLSSTLPSLPATSCPCRALSHLTSHQLCSHLFSLSPRSVCSLPWPSYSAATSSFLFTGLGLSSLPVSLTNTHQPLAFPSLQKQSPLIYLAWPPPHPPFQ